MRSISVTKLCGPYTHPPAKRLPLVGEVTRTTEKAVLFASPDLKDIGIASPLWIPRAAIEQGASIEVGDTELSVDEGFINRKAEP